ncbi:hypothetical protein [Anabaena sp. UHCC 0451]|uniref:hypothetical protein n=1 Tax=Anabaena sp. UHCC 0451 TaxID=2055235 RepID=UPI002B1EB8BC|nr:hypothetical protein [Anabaena sp. UHCC 0451]MEA5576332.1 hypothetical protein [Anabaena sp. UHCC 0451]
MLYLAQVHKNNFLDQYQLRLLARQESEYSWSIISEEAFILLGKENTWGEKVLVLAELSATGEIEKIEDSTSWVLYLIQTYLKTGITPDFLLQETEKMEDWLQSLTLQNQDLARRTLELEARREQIQALEESLKRDQNSQKQDNS